MCILLKYLKIKCKLLLVNMKYKITRVKCYEKREKKVLILIGPEIFQVQTFQNEAISRLKFNIHQVTT